MREERSAGSEDRLASDTCHVPASYAMRSAQMLGRLAPAGRTLVAEYTNKREGSPMR